jgi:cytochrome b pre-mRNA-processing protein 3
MFADMDDVLRESGVGDLSVGRKIRSMSEAFYGRVKAYEEAMAAGEDALAAALGRNVYGGAEAGAAPARLACYVRAVAATLAAASLGSLAAGTIVFPAAGGEP